MEEKGRHWIPALLFGWVIPMLLLHGAGNLAGVYETLPAEPEASETEQAELLRISVLMEDQTVQMELEAYLVGVVLGEMPASFEPEALKAQAVVARTYTLRRVWEAPKHTDGAVCTDPACCQAYSPPESCVDAQALSRISEAVQSTAGMVLTYGGRLIEATYFSSSGGRTEDALAVWGSDLPYLQAVDSPEEGYEDRYLAQVTMTAREFSRALGLELSGSPATWVRAVTYTNGGGVDTMDIGGFTFSGTELRRLLGLRSTAFVIHVEGDAITLVTRGYGHRVGMSQYGAQAMAQKGSTCLQILNHYYPGTELEEFVDIMGEFG